MKAVLGVLGLLVVVVLVVAAAEDGNGTVFVEDGVETFEQVEKNIKSAVGNMVKRILPYIMESGAGMEVSGPCRSSILKIIAGVRQLREWAMRFIDATGKIPPGILEGTSFSIGDYDECLDIEVGKRDEIPKTPAEVVFRGQYCLIEAHRPEGINRAIADYQNGNKDNPIAKTKTFLNMFIRYKHLTNSTFKLGLCVPSKCSKQDLENMLNTEDLRTAGKITVFYCKQHEEEVKSAELILLMCLFGFVLGIMVVGTIVDMMMRLRRKDDKLKESSLYIKYLEQVTKNTSLYTNAIDALCTTSQEKMKTLCGIRPIVVILIIYSHTYGHIHILHFQKFSRAANFLKFFDSFTFAGIANGSVAVDTIFLVTGIMITYNTWRFVSEKSKVNLGICKMLLQRYFRMTAAQLLSICVFLLLPLFGSGPFWKPYMGPELNNCRNKWWLNILYVNNFLETNKTCLYHTWILAMIMQLSLLSAFILWMLKKSLRFGVFLLMIIILSGIIGVGIVIVINRLPRTVIYLVTLAQKLPPVILSLRFGVFFLMIIILSGIIGVGIVTVINRLPGTMAFYMLDIRTGPITWSDVFILPYDHMGPFSIGLLAGYFLAVKKDQLNISRTTSVILWCLSISCSSAVMFGLYSYRHGADMDISLSAFYAVTHRNVWALSIAWLIIACTTRHGGAVARVLQSKFFVPVDRLCYLAYLLHIPLMYYHSGVMRERWYMGHFELIFMAIGYIILSFVGSFFLHIIFVKPYFAIEDFVSSFFKTKRKMSLHLRCKQNDNMKTTVSAISEAPVLPNVCGNATYSKKLDGI